MIVFFKDGSITNDSLYIDGKEVLKIDAGMGYSHCRRRLRYIQDNYPFDTEVFTNSLIALSNLWCWDYEKNMPLIYIQNEEGNWMFISELTNRELRIRHNLEKLYVNGEFCDVET